MDKIKIVTKIPHNHPSIFSVEFEEFENSESKLKFPSI